MRLRTKDGLEAVVHRLVAVNGRIAYLSMGGHREGVEAVWGALANHHFLTLVGGEKKVELARTWGNLRYRKARLGQVYHGLVVSDLVRNGEVLIWQNPEEAAKAMARALGIPVLSVWVSHLVQAVQEVWHQEVLALGVEALHLPPMMRDRVRTRLGELLRAGELPLPLEAL